MIEFLHPWVLVALPLPVVAWFLLPPLAANAAVPVPLPIRNLIVGLSAQTMGRRQVAPHGIWLKALGWIALVIAVAGPYTHIATLLPPTGRDLIVAIDLSASMEETDMLVDEKTVSRFEVVAPMIKDFIGARKGDRVGLIAYGHEAFLIAPLSFDVAAVAGTIDELQIGLPGHRTDLGRAVGLALKSLGDDDENHKVLVLLSDGEDNSGELTGIDAAGLAAERGVKVYTIGFSSNIQADGADILRTMAASANGAFYWAQSAESLASTSDEIRRLEPVEEAIEEEHIRRDWTPYFTVLALILMAAVVVQDLRQR